MRIRYIVAMLFLLSGVTVGCSYGPDENPVDVAPPAPTEAIGVVLEDIIEQGQMHSGAQIIQNEIQVIRETDPAKADKLQAMYDQLMSLGGNPTQLKAKAKEMQAAL